MKALRPFIFRRHQTLVLLMLSASSLTACVMRRGALVSENASEESPPPAMRFTAVRAQGDASCAIRDDQTLWCWGFNERNALGLGGDNAIARPTQVGPLTNVVDVAPAEDHTCALRADHTLFCVGRGKKGQLGDGTNLDRANAVQVPGAYTSVAVATGITCATTTSEELFCWGAEDATRKLAASVRPLKVAGGDSITRVTAVGSAWRKDGSVFSFASLSKDGDLVCEVRADGTMWCAGAEVAKVMVQMGRAANWTAVATGTEHACALRANGGVYCFGANTFGQLGVGRGSLDVPFSPSFLPTFFATHTP